MDLKDPLRKKNTQIVKRKEKKIMGINFKELQKKMETVGDNGISKLNMRNEEKQRKFQPKRFTTLRRKRERNHKLCSSKENCNSFNPKTGKEDDTYNTGSKWRPPYSVESVIKLVKSYARRAKKLNRL